MDDMARQECSELPLWISDKAHCWTEIRTNDSM